MKRKLTRCAVLPAPRAALACIYRSVPAAWTKPSLRRDVPTLHSLLEPARDVRDSHHVLDVGITLGLCQPVYGYKCEACVYRQPKSGKQDHKAEGDEVIFHGRFRNSDRCYGPPFAFTFPLAAVPVQNSDRASVTAITF